MKLKLNLKKTTVSEIQKQLKEIEKANIPDYNLITYDYTSLYPSSPMAKFSDEFLRKLKIGQRIDKLNRILGEE